MSRLICVAVLAAYCVSLISGHAVLTNPIAWNPSPSKGNPCGGGAATLTASGRYQEGASITLNWRVVAGDGNGAVSLAFNPMTAAAVPATFTITGVPTTASPQNPPVAVGLYTLTATLPPTVTPGLYTMQAQSTTAWFSCATVNVTRTPTTPVAPANNGGPSQPTAVCVARPTTMGFCNNLEASVSIDIAGNPNLANMVSYDSTVLSTYNANMQSRLMFGNAGANAACATAYKRFLCANEFPFCGNSQLNGACKSACYEMSQACDLQDSHKDLYDCASNQITARDSVGTCAPCTGACALTLGASSHVTYSFAVLVSLFAAVFAARNL